MDEYEKIARLLEEGKISPEEAEKLLDALEPAEPAGEVEAGAQEGWLEVVLERADLSIRVDPSLSEPRVLEDGGLKIAIKRTKHGWKFKGPTTRIGIFNLVRARKKAALAIPPGLGLKLRLGQGKVDIAGKLPALDLQLGQGQVRFGAVERLRLSLGQGKVNGRALLTAGKHSVSLGMGRVNLALEEGSDLRFELEVALGEMAVTGTEKHASEGRGGKYSGTLGEGRGYLKVSVGMGEVEVKTP